MAQPVWAHPTWSNRGLTRAVVVAAVATLASASSVLAVVHAEPPASTLESLVADLARPDPLTRTSASEQLESDPSVTLKEIETVLARPGLSAEQTRRLMAAAEARFLREPRAAVGVTFNQFEQDRNGSVVLDNVEATFPAAAVLQAGDRIEAIDGVRLSAVNPMRPHILSRDPGDTIPMTIVRQGVTMNVVVTLGRWADLRDRRRGGQGFVRSMDPREEDFEAAWRVRLRRIQQPAPLEVIDAVVPPAPKPEANDEPALEQGRVEGDDGLLDARGVEAMLAQRELVAAGEPHGGKGREAPELVAAGNERAFNVVRQGTDRDRLIRALQRNMEQREIAVRQLEILNRAIRETPPGPELIRLQENARRTQEMIQRWGNSIMGLQARLQNR